MRIKPNTTVGRLIEEHPEATEVMAWYGIDLEECRPSTTLATLCRGNRLDVDDVVADLASSLEELEDEDEDEDEELEDEDSEDDDGWASGDDDLDDDLDDDDLEGEDDDDEEEDLDDFDLN